MYRACPKTTVGFFLLVEHFGIHHKRATFGHQLSVVKGITLCQTKHHFMILNLMVPTYSSPPMSRYVALLWHIQLHCHFF